MTRTGLRQRYTEGGRICTTVRVRCTSTSAVAVKRFRFSCSTEAKLRIAGSGAWGSHFGTLSGAVTQYDYVFLYAQPQMWPAVAKMLGQPELTEDARFKTVEARWDNRAELNAIVEAWTRQRSKHEVMRLMGDAGVPCGACQDTGEVLGDPHLKAREMIVDVDYPTRGTYQTVGCPIKLSDSPVAVSRPPLLGEHTDELLESLCGVEPDEAKRLRQEGVV